MIKRTDATKANAPFETTAKWSVLREVTRLDPVKDNQRIAFLSASYDFPWDTQRAYELALLRTFAVPRSSELLVSTEEFTKRTQKRYDDTTIIISTIGFYGYDSLEGRAAIRRMNQLHARYEIPNNEFLYVLSTFILEPLRWNDSYGWRALSEQERQASFYFWREVGRRMNIQDIPDSLEKLEAWSLAYEAEHFAYSENNELLAQVTRDLFLSWVLPKPLWGIGKPFVHVILGRSLRSAFGFPEPPRWASICVALGLGLRKYVLRLTPPRKKPYTLPTTRTYPAGYDLETIGPASPTES